MLSSSSSTSPDWRRHARLLINLFTTQLLRGCGHAQCTTPSCYTTRKRLCPWPARIYTQSSALILATSLASSHDPLSALCPFVAELTDLSAHWSDPSDNTLLHHRLQTTDAVRSLVCDPVRPARQALNDVHRGCAKLELRIIRCEQPHTAEPVETLESRPSNMCASPFAPWSSAHTFAKAFPLRPVDVCRGLRVCDGVWFRFSAAYSAWRAAASRDPFPFDLLHTALLYLQRQESAHTCSRQHVGHFLVLAICALCAYRTSADAGKVQPPESFERSLARYLSELVLRIINGSEHVNRAVIVAYIFDQTKASRNTLALTPTVAGVWIKFLIESVEHHITEVFSEDSTFAAVVGAMDQLWYHRQWLLLEPAAFCVARLDLTLDPNRLALSWIRHKASKGRHHILSVSILFTKEHMGRIFRALCFIRMHRAFSPGPRLKHMRDVVATGMSARLLPRYLDRVAFSMLVTAHQTLRFEAKRDDLLHALLAELWHQESSHLLKPLEVELEQDLGEMGQDRGGVQVEALRLAFIEVMRPEYGECLATKVLARF